MINLTFSIKPKAKQSVRMSTANGRLFFHRKPEVKAFEDKIKWIAKSQLPKEFKIYERGPLEVIVEYRYKKKGIKKDSYKTTRPDIDSNLNKALFDALTGLVWIDDAIISKITAIKYYSYEDRITIKINQMEEL